MVQQEQADDSYLKDSLITQARNNEVQPNPGPTQARSVEHRAALLIATDDTRTTHLTAPGEVHAEAVN